MFPHREVRTLSLLRRALSLLCTPYYTCCPVCVSMDDVIATRAINPFALCKISPIANVLIARSTRMPHYKERINLLLQL
jgi:hypothetical protein